MELLTILFIYIYIFIHNFFITKIYINNIN